MKPRNVLIFLVTWRLISVYVVQTSHVPDEYWQSLEVAHRLSFGYGYLTWEWRAKIRSYIYPFLISLLYRLLALFRLDRVILLTTMPRIFQALLSAYADHRFYVWTKSKWGLFTLCTNWYWYYCATRTLTNSLETALTTIALSMFPWSSGNSRSTGFIWIVAFLTVVRPTTAVIWAPLCIYRVLSSSQSILYLIKRYFTIGIITIIYAIAIDSLCYGTFVITPWEFFKINVLNNVADFYGTQHIFWYLVAGLPVVLGVHAFIFPATAWSALRNSKSLRPQAVMVLVICWTVTIYSALPHKEFRFILPLLPMFIYVCASSGSFLFKFRITELRRKVLLSIFILSNLLPGVYLCLIHQRGALDLMKLLEDELANGNGTTMDIMFLTPCHATPLYSHLHTDVPIKFLTCEPNLQQLPDYIDEADVFFANPSNWLNQHFRYKNVSTPNLLIIFDNLYPKIMPFLKNYKLLAKVFNTHLPQPNYGEYIMLFKSK